MSSHKKLELVVVVVVLILEHHHHDWPLFIDITDRSELFRTQENEPAGV